MKNDRFLLGIMIFIGVIVVAAFALFFARGSDQVYMQEDSPEAIVHNFTLAVTQREYVRAYGYIAEGPGKPSEAIFFSHFNQYDPLQNAGLRVGTAEILGAQAVVDVTVIYGSTGPFDSGYSSRDSALLSIQDGAWKIEYMPYPYWEYGWLDNKGRP